MPAKLTVAKIVSTATSTAWSQAYHAGGFTAVLSISKKEEAEVTETELQKTGKQLIDTLISEYFTLVTKDLHTVRGAVQASVDKLPKTIGLSMVVGASVKNVLYIVIVNHGKALLKRGEKSGVLLELDAEDQTPQIESVSGYLEQGDIIVLETKEFEEVLPQHELLASIDHQTPPDLAEILSPKIHEAQNGGASAIIFSYHEEEPSLLEKSFTPTSPPVEEKEEERHVKFLAGDKPEEKPHESSYSEEKEPEEKEVAEEKEVEEPVSSEPLTQDNFARPVPEEEEKKEVSAPIPQQVPQQEAQPFQEPTRSRINGTSPQTSTRGGISHSQKIFLTIAVIIAIVLGSSIFFFLSKQEEAKHQQVFDAVYTPAKIKYEEGVGLMNLNKDVALSDLNQAKDMVSSGEAKLPSNSPQYKKLQDLLTQINASIQTASQVQTITTAKAPDNASPLLSFAAKHTSAQYVTQDDTNFYTGDASGITQYNKSTGKEKQLITNTSDWKAMGGLGTYLNNIYVLDKKDGIIKYVNGTTKQSYFATGTAPDLSNATSLAIDMSIWVLKSDGTILKFTRGKQDSFSINGLDKAFVNPSSIVTTLDDENIYILDKGNSRLVVIKKSGVFANQYAAPVIKNADGLDIDEKGKKAYILSGGTVYQVDLK